MMMQLCSVKIISHFNFKNMKKTILSLAVIAFMAGSISTTFAQEQGTTTQKSNDNLTEAQKSSVNPQKGMQTPADSIAEFQKFKAEYEAKIQTNEKNLVGLKQNVSVVKENDKESYLKEISEFETQNKGLKKQLAEYKYVGQANWSIFKNKFSEELEKLTKSIKEFTVNSAK